jgi:hypothetical protein
MHGFNASSHVLIAKNTNHVTDYADFRVLFGKLSTPIYVYGLRRLLISVRAHRECRIGSETVVHAHHTVFLAAT